MKRLTVDELTGTPIGKPAIKLKPGGHRGGRLPGTGRHRGGGGRLQRAGPAHPRPRLVPVQGRGAGGVAGMKLGDGATVVGAGPAGEDSIVLTVTDAQTAKVTDAGRAAHQGPGHRRAAHHQVPRPRSAWSGPTSAPRMACCWWWERRTPPPGPTRRRSRSPSRTRAGTWRPRPPSGGSSRSASAAGERQNVRGCRRPPEGGQDPRTAAPRRWPHSPGATGTSAGSTTGAPAEART